MITELRLAYIHHYMHPDKKTIYVHDDKSKRFKGYEQVYGGKGF